jgi:hypothetical protein
MPVPIVPLALGAGLALWTLYEQQRSKEQHAAAPAGSAAPAGAIPPVPLLPGAQMYLPPIAAPESIRNAFANALYSKNPTALRTTAQSFQALGYGDLAKPLLATADNLEHVPAVRGDWFAGEASRVYPTVGGHHRRGRVGDDLEALVRTAGVGAWHAHPLAHRRAALLAWARRRRAIGDDLDALTRAAGVGEWPEDIPIHPDQARVGRARRRAAVGREPPIFVGAHPHAHRRRAIRRILRTV